MKKCLVIRQPDPTPVDLPRFMMHVQLMDLHAYNCRETPICYSGPLRTGTRVIIIFIAWPAH